MIGRLGGAGGGGRKDKGCEILVIWFPVDPAARKGMRVLIPSLPSALGPTDSERDRDSDRERERERARGRKCSRHHRQSPVRSFARIHRYSTLGRWKNNPAHDRAGPTHVVGEDTVCQLMILRSANTSQRALSL